MRSSNLRDIFLKEMSPHQKALNNTRSALQKTIDEAKVRGYLVKFWLRDYPYYLFPLASILQMVLSRIPFEVGDEATLQDTTKSDAVISAFNTFLENNNMK